jgi:replicative DNA helicase
LKNVALTADAFQADLILIDYVQRFTASDQQGDRRGAVDAAMSQLRQFADADCGFIVVSAVGRQRDGKGKSSYDGLNLASLKESGELEYGADSCFLLIPDPDHGDDAVMLQCVKNRHGEPLDVPLRFDRRCQRFDPIETAPMRPETDRLNRTRLADLWAQTTPDEEDAH